MVGRNDILGQYGWEIELKKKQKTKFTMVKMVHSPKNLISVVIHALPKLSKMTTTVLLILFG